MQSIGKNFNKGFSLGRPGTRAVSGAFMPKGHKPLINLKNAGNIGSGNLEITRIEPFIMHIPVSGGGIADSTHAITHWGLPGTRINPSNGLTGWGFTGTHAFLPGDQLITSCIKNCFALGESLYHSDAFQNFMDADAVHYVQPDVTRLGGITEFLTVADGALARRLPVVPHAGELGQIHVHLAYNHPACPMMEFIPWIKDAFEEPIVVKDGNFQKPVFPGASTTPTREALEQFSRPLG